MKTTIVEKVLIQSGSRTELFAVATSQRSKHSVCKSLTHEAHLTAWQPDRLACEQLQREIEAELPAFKVTSDNGSSYTTSMAAHVTIQDARDYFLGQTFTDEDAAGHETRRKVVAIEEVLS